MVLGIYGAGGLAREVLEVARCINEKQRRWHEIVFVDLKEQSNQINQTRVISEDMANKIQDFQAVIAVGEPSIREKIYDRITQKGKELATLIHPSVRIPDSSSVGKGSVICSNVLLSCNVFLDNNVYVQPHAVIGHETKIGMHSTIGANSVVGGNNNIGKRVFMGLLSGTIQGLTISDDVEISAGAIVFRNVENSVILMGNPAKVIRRNEGNGVFTNKDGGNKT